MQKPADTAVDLAALNRPEVFEEWLSKAIQAYAETLEPNIKSGLVGDADERLGAQAVFDARRKILAPARYDGEQSFQDYVTNAAGAANTAAPREEGPLDRYRPLHTLDETVEKLLKRWEPRDGAGVLYLLLELAQKRRIEPALNRVSHLISGSKLASASAAWRRAIGRKAVALGSLFPDNLHAVPVLNELPGRSDFWSPTFSGMAATGLVQANPANWRSVFMRFEPSLRMLSKSQQKSNLRNIVGGAGLRNVLVESCASFPSVFGVDYTPHFNRSAAFAPSLDLIYSSAATPIKTEFEYITLNFKFRDVEYEIAEIVQDAEVEDAFRYAMGGSLQNLELAEVCQEDFRALTGVEPDWTDEAGLALLEEADGQALTLLEGADESDDSRAISEKFSDFEDHFLNFDHQEEMGLS